jgi:hypothetical protein
MIFAGAGHVERWPDDHACLAAVRSLPILSYAVDRDRSFARITAEYGRESTNGRCYARCAPEWWVRRVAGALHRHCHGSQRKRQRPLAMTARVDQTGPDATCSVCRKRVARKPCFGDVIELEEVADQNVESFVRRSLSSRCAGLEIA